MLKADKASENTALALGVRADKIRLLYRQSFHGAFGSLVAASMWAGLMWSAVPRSRLGLWFAALGVVTIIRLLIFRAYFRSAKTDEAVLAWERPYTLSLYLSSIVWGIGTVMVMPEDSLLHQTITYVFLIGLAGAALSAYGVFMRMATVVVSIVLLPMVAFLAWEAHAITLWLAVAGIWFFLTTLRGIHVHTGTVDQSFRLGRELTEAKRIAEMHARTDELTGLANRRAFNESASALLKLDQRERRPTSLVLFDLDDFKLINDSHGHSAGDAVLRQVAESLSGVLRASDVTARLGGDEFAILLPGTDAESARQTAQKVHDALDQSPPRHEGRALPVTLSMGIAGQAGTLEAMLIAADRAMYAAKRAGKDRTAANDA